MEKLGLRRDIDLALHLPLRYEDETRLTPIGRLRDSAAAQVEGVVRSSQIQGHGRRQLVVHLHDDSGELVLRFLHFHAGQQRALAVGQRVRARGEARHGFFGVEMVHPTVRVVAEGEALPTQLTPVYPTSASLPQAYLRKAVAAGLRRADLSECIPTTLMPPGLPRLHDALRWLHQPPPAALPALDERSDPAWQRLKFDELLAQQLSQLQAKLERSRQRAPRLATGAGLLPEQLLAVLPFALTAAQHRVVEEIAADLARPVAPAQPGGPAPKAGPGEAPAEFPWAVPMHRLLQGDVGSGKTVVAALVAAIAMANGWQCALMAPTEIVAEQHFRKLVDWLAPLGVTTAWLTGSRKGKGRREMLAQVASGEALLVVGTHAVIQDDVHFARLGLAIIDEQHRFGVEQRLALRGKLVGPEVDGARLEPHLLMMSATPIPRTLAMTVYADLDISTIDTLPPGRTPIVTKVFADDKREAVVARIRDEVAQGRQVYWVCPLIEESEHLDLQNATLTHELLCAALPGIGVGLLHGRMPQAEKAETMARFSSGAMALLVATTVVEVGVDVPNASLMVIEHAERFGLSQLHQLRGRVGRGAAASVCVLLYSGPLSATAKQRLKAMIETTDGFEIARRDLEIRGPGEFLGARQSGAALLRFADPLEDGALVAAARRAALVLLEHHAEAAARHLARWHSVKAEYLKA